MNDTFIERLEEAHEFPGPYTFKVIGGQTDGFVELVLATVQGELKLVESPQHSLKRTPNGRHVSITIDLRVESASQVATLYDRLQSMDEVRFLM